MKKLFLLLILVSGFTFAQIENFVIDGSQVSWQKVYETDNGFEEIIESLKNRNNLIIKEKNESSIEGEISNLIMDYRKAGFSRMGTPFVLNDDNKYSGYFKIEFKDGKYRASARNITSKGASLTLYSGGLGMGSNLDTSLEQMALNNKGEIRKSFPKVAGKIIDATFINLFDFTKKKDVKKDEW